LSLDSAPASGHRDNQSTDGALIGAMSQPASFVALRCAACSTFQVQQHKVSGKFACRSCGEKQSVLRVYARDAKAANVRAIVHQLSMLQGEGERAMVNELARALDEDDAAGWEEGHAETLEPVRQHVLVRPAESKWSRFVTDAPSHSAAAEASEGDDARDEPYVASRTPAPRAGGTKRRGDGDLASRAPPAAPAGPVVKSVGASKWAKFC
jgi:hypothetical protein